MTPSAIFVPFFVVMLLTMIVWIYTYARRIPFVRGHKLTPEQLTPSEFARISPPAVSNPSDNLKNLFEVPTLFYAVVLYLYVTQQVDTTYVIAAWMFVAFRILHSAVQCTINIIILRFTAYAASTLALWFMLIRASVNAVR